MTLGPIIAHFASVIVCMAVFQVALHQQVFAADYGDYIVDIKELDLQDVVDAALAAGEKSVTIPPGYYRSTKYPDEAPGFLTLDGVEDFTINAEGVEMLFHMPMRALNLSNCKNVTIRGLGIDYDPVGFVQVRVTKVSKAADGKGFAYETEILGGYPDNPMAGTRKVGAFLYDPETLLLKRWYSGLPMERSSDRIITITDGSDSSHVEVGDLFAFYNTRKEKIQSGKHSVRISNCEDLVLENVVLYASVSMGFLETGCSNTIYRGCAVKRRPPETDFQKREVPRLRSGAIDAFHSKSARIGPKYHNCMVEANGDDHVAINGDYHFVYSCDGNDLMVVGKRGLGALPEVGAEVELIEYTSGRKHVATVTDRRDVGEINAEMKENISKRSEQRVRKFLNEYAIITIDQELSLECGSLLADMTRMGNGFEIINGNFSIGRSRGIIVKASRGVIRGNTIFNTGTPIKLVPEAYWLEAGSSSDVIIEDNNVEGRITVEAATPRNRDVPAECGAFQNITIRNNVIKASTTGMRLTSIENLILENNEIIQESREDGEEYPAMEIIRCTGPGIPEEEVLDSTLPGRVFQVDERSIQGEARWSNDFKGHTGDGYAHFPYKTTKMASVQFDNIHMDADARATLWVRYISPRESPWYGVDVNGQRVDRYKMTETKSFSIWGLQEVEINLRAGNNQITVRNEGYFESGVDAISIVPIADEAVEGRSSESVSAE